MPEAHHVAAGGLVEHVARVMGWVAAGVHGQPTVAFARRVRVPDEGHVLPGQPVGARALGEGPDGLADDPPAERHQVDFSRIGIFHFCLETDDFQGVIERVLKFGGKTRMDIMRYHPEDESKPYKMVYLEDPFGNLFELYSHSYRETYSSEYE